MLTADFALCPGKAVGWAVQLPGCPGQPYYPGGTRRLLSSYKELQIAFLPGCGPRTGSLANRGHLLEFPNLAKLSTGLYGQMESLAGLCKQEYSTSGYENWLLYNLLH